MASPCTTPDLWLIGSRCALPHRWHRRIDRGGATVTPWNREGMMQTWEYLVSNVQAYATADRSAEAIATDVLNALGHEGWELVTVDRFNEMIDARSGAITRVTFRGFLKRPKAPG